MCFLGLLDDEPQQRDGVIATPNPPRLGEIAISRESGADGARWRDVVVALIGGFRVVYIYIYIYVHVCLSIYNTVGYIFIAYTQQAPRSKEAEDDLCSYGPLGLWLFSLYFFLRSGASRRLTVRRHTIFIDGDEDGDSPVFRWDKSRHMLHGVLLRLGVFFF